MGSSSVFQPDKCRTDPSQQPHVFYKRYVPPFVPSINPLDPSDTSQFDDVFLTMEPQINEETAAGAERDPPEGEPQAGFDDECVLLPRSSLCH